MNAALRLAARATREADEARVVRDRAIREAAASHSYREIAEATGLSKPRVGQIVTDPRPR